ncbi:MAG TPA: CapA family protein [Rhizomicrobium sp.]|jgi:poly-gamma-glutamate capsule biosynthesis protein CapA/YwtB (metallophosphatase superfamily)|nr:CapA family protein [Rhizomicrobium sp.]
MMRNRGWDHGEEYGWFMSAALVPLALALVALIAAHLLVYRYDAKLAAGDFGAPPGVLAGATVGNGVPVLGAAIGDVPDAASLDALRAELDARLSGLPWQRALVRRNRAAAPLVIQSLFFPFNQAADALAFCRHLASAAPGCTTLIASTRELTTLDGRTANLARLGVAPFTGGSNALPVTRTVYVQLPPRTVLAPAPPARIVYVPVPAKALPAPPPKTIVVQAPAPPPKIVYLPAPDKPAPPPPKPQIVYLPTPAPSPKIVYLPAPAAPDVKPAPVPVLAGAQPALKLQPGVGAGEVHYPEQQIWLSAAYKPGDPRLVDIVGAGDVMMGSISAGLNPALRPGVDVAALVGADLAGIFRHADVAFVNLEGPLYEGGQGTGKDCAQCFAFHGPTFYAGILRSFGIDVVSLANNHSGDYGEAGRDSTMAALRANGIVYGGLDRDGARAGEMVLPGGKRVAMISFAPNNGTLNINDLPRAAELVRDLKKTHDLVMVSFHGGGEGWTYVHVKPGPEMFVGENRGNVTAFAHTVIDAGADIVMGQGPHVPRALEVYRGHLIAYSLGNFWTYSGVQTYAVSGLGPVLEAWVAPDGAIAGFTIHSTRQAGLGVPHLDPLDEAARYMLYLTRSDFPATAALLAGHRTLASNGGS